MGCDDLTVTEKLGQIFLLNQKNQSAIMISSKHHYLIHRLIRVGYFIS